MKSIVRIFIVTISGTLAIEMNKLLIENMVDIRISILLSSVFAATFYAGITYIATDLLLNFTFIRHILDKRSKYEGYYIERFINLETRPVSVAKLSYNPESKSYSYSGRAYDKDGNLKATWGVLSICIWMATRA